ncbi:tRNA (adenosine(37)-N6)-dimethylallyltransferase MiaA [Aequorivita marina]|uniref:tRNA (adenosine(37)-N6)-dimethylallyltransferase MiaA n=1 Tax=Aequorivita marina TaxID=3073654 RepID=UPI002875D149|nr:tRNA (adenosine(37)-N6)-dimethylallyltransferase MiaA [Aequorivita sp. S2608]MDS1299784.1 tRNA (adenosine(37)-N6)-dimethylallyltransferase MiaA [Aequorivita sp. S2608]
MNSKTPTLICVVGPTAIGKTALAIKLANAFSSEIISADSRQFYKEMNIGTAVPSQDELNAAKHHFIQNISVFQNYSVGDFETDALTCLESIFQRNSVCIMVGGSGLYVDAVVKGLDKFPKVSPHIREALNAEVAENGIEALQRELKEKDPIYFEKVDIHNPHRLVRALEICRGTGKPYSSFLNKESDKRSFKTIFIGLTAERAIIYNRINERVDQMIANGLLEEAKNLYPHKALNALQTVGYRELFNYFDGMITKEEAIAEIKKNTRRFSKRQNTWFKKNEDIHWFDYQTNFEAIVGFIKEKNAL